MSLVSNINANPNTVEYGKFVELSNDARFPAISTTRIYYRGNDIPPISSVDIYKKYAVLTYNVNQGQSTSNGWDIAIASAVVGSFTAYSNTVATGATIYNNTGVSINIKRTGGTNSIALANGLSLQIPISGNLNEISVQSSSGTVNVPCLYTV